MGKHGSLNWWAELGSRFFLASCVYGERNAFDVFPIFAFLVAFMTLTTLSHSKKRPGGMQHLVVLQVLAIKVVSSMDVLSYLLPPTLNVAFRSLEPRIAEPFPNEKLLRKGKDCGYRANNFSLGIGSAIHISKDLNTTFNVSGKSNWVRLMIIR